jgi:hypothetical protein
VKTGKFVLLALVVCLPAMAVAQAAAPVSILDWLSQAMAVVKEFIGGNITWQVKVAAVIALIISSMNVTVLNQWFWQKLGNFQIWLAPALGLLAGLVNAMAGGSWSSILAYIVAGGGAVFIHEILELVKLIPGIGPTYIAIIDLIENMPVVGTQSAGKSQTKTS